MNGINDTHNRIKILLTMTKVYCNYAPNKWLASDNMSRHTHGDSYSGEECKCFCVGKNILS